MIGLGIAGIGLHAPGLPDWAQGREVLAGRAAPAPGDTPAPQPEHLSPRERRRVSQAVRLALAVGQEAVSDAGLDPAGLPSVFGWAHGDGATVQKILMELTTAERHVSPKDFHHSVHNVAVGYWAIATGAHRPCTSVAAALDTFPAALTKTAAQIAADREPVLLVVFDTPFPEPLNRFCPVGAAIGAGFVLTPPDDPRARVRLAVDYVSGPPPEPAPELPAELRAGPPFDDFWRVNAAARTGPLLRALAEGRAHAFTLPYGPSAGLSVEVGPC